MDLYQHFREEEYPFIDQVLSWRDHVETRYEMKITDFLHPREQKIFRTIIGNDENLQLSFFGGWDQAERKRAILAPFYQTIQESSYEVDLLEATYPQKFVTIEHPDVLGAFLSAGIKRKKIGDIVINDNQVQILVARDITAYLLANITSIKKARVQFEQVPIQNRIVPQESWQEKITTCSSLRLDVVLKEIYQLSRKQALTYIQKGLVKVNFQTVEQPSFVVEADDLLSVRGKGRASIADVQGYTKKGKIRISYEKLL
ncbi:hypothetical protein J416_01194 [Gracilibacillus halophilus YIM-C55.5]|uniref:RNA-binding S4 domain-containing protein n=1 Tax=Gracilibacillus halophilus YIM-C55.5 TaxID=1308866 RepID=N4WQ95_9BACI|nr:RNA-binding protein [Gracilibacillus halophilus]ENH98312.1 hypothetical protein J416_01194 [Gracilibacillus halophilus YIM-C55.5]